MLDRRSISMFVSFILIFLDLTASFYLKEERYKKKISEFEEVVTITDPAKVKLLMAQPAKEEFKFIPVIIPDKFSKYDIINHDGQISLKELIRTTGAERNAKNAFQAADEDADGEISREEFKKAPWSMKPTSINSKDKEEYIEGVKFEHVTDDEEIKVDNGGRNDIEEEETGEEEEKEEGDIETGGKYEEGGEKSFIEIVEGRGKDFVIKNEKKEKMEIVEVKRVEVKGDKERGGEERGEEVVIIEENGVEGEEKVLEEEEVKGGVKRVASKVGGMTDKEEETEEKDRKVRVGIGEVGHIERVKNESMKTIEAIERESKEEQGGGRRERNSVNEGKQAKADDIEESKHEDDIEKEDLEKKHIQHSDPKILDPHKLVESSSQVDFIEDDEESSDWLDSDETSGESEKGENDSDQESDSEDEEGKTTSEQNDESFED